ncbi:MAG: hypothetical protein C4520_11120 [Candidatus Abyssobacteria bacterium SURF_5]|uniref:Uncharacterized protein n=1 Tax=Abyssobacteria bacterium (strain SURF_5) TaxID=2093360 RepID=A0A3A4NP34_ABYX5|nr:MAG: hypothetical protein C4520_11120 [Candidatus Abyssubacteria bacterium SURF_5]
MYFSDLAWGRGTAPADDGDAPSLFQQDIRVYALDTIFQKARQVKRKVNKSQRLVTIPHVFVGRTLEKA